MDQQQGANVCEIVHKYWIMKVVSLPSHFYNQYRIIGRVACNQPDY